MDMHEKEDGELFEIVTCPSDYTKEEVAEAARELERRGYTVYKKVEKLHE